MTSPVGAYCTPTICRSNWPGVSGSSILVFRTAGWFPHGLARSAYLGNATREGTGAPPSALSHSWNEV